MRSVDGRAAIQALYDEGAFLAAYAATASCWKPGSSIADFSVEDLVLGSRLAARLGGSRMARWLCRENLRRDPTHPEVRYFSRHLSRNGRDILNVLRCIEAEPELAGASPVLQASWLASNASMWAVVGDFERAEACIERALALKVRDGWVATCEADVLLRADRWEESAAAAERAWQERPGVPYSARAVSVALSRLGRFEEAADRLATAAERGQSFEVAQTACWQLCAWAERTGGAARQEALERARNLARRLPEFAPLADRETKLGFAHIQLDIASLLNDSAEMNRLAAEIRHPFFRAVAANRAARPDGRRIVLSCRREFQTYNTCLPCSVASALSGLGVDIDWRALAADLTHEGTAMWATADWLEKRQFATRYFIVTPERARALLRAGIPFVLTLDAENASHAVAAIGFDESSDTLILHDPSLARHSEWLVEGLGEGAAPLGPRGLVVVPADRAGELRTWIPDAEHDLAAVFHQHQRAHDTRGPAAAREVADQFARRFPGHPVACYLMAVSLHEQGRFGEALALLEKLLADHPQCLMVRRLLVAVSGAIGNTVLQRRVLTDIVDRGLLPGVNAAQTWRRAPSTYVCQLAELLRTSAATRPRAIRLLRGVLRSEPANGEAWHILGDALCDEARPSECELPLRIAMHAARLAEHYARAWCDTMRRLGREDEALSALERRARRLGTSGIGVAPWINWIDTLEDYGHPERALAAHEEMAERFPAHPERLGWSASFLARMGRWEDADATLVRLQATGQALREYEASAALCRMRGSWRPGCDIARRWLAETPLSMNARRHLLYFTTQAEGSRAAVTMAAEWSAEQPEQDELELLHYEQLNQDGRSGEAERVLRARLQRNPEDAWAWRELAFIVIEAFARRPAASGEVERVLAECDRTSAGDPATWRARALYLEVQGRWAEATAAWCDAVKADPLNLYAVNHALDCAARLPAAERHALVHELEPALLTPARRMTGARQLLSAIASRYGPGLAGECAQRWREKRPDDPEVLLAVADLWIDYGHGRTDAARARDLLVPAVERYPYHAGLREALSRAWQRLGMIQEAVATTAEIVRRHPADTVSRVRLSYMHERLGDRDAAVRELAVVAEIGRQSTSTWAARVRFHLRQGDRSAAMNLIRCAFEQFPDHVGWYHAGTELLVEAGEPAWAVASARRLVEHRPDNPPAWRLLGELLQQQHELAQPGECEAALRRALELDAGNFEAADLLAIALAAQNRHDEAAGVIRDFERRLADPSPARGRNAWLLRSTDKQRGREAMTGAVLAAPWYAWGWGQLITWLQEDKAWEDARRLLRDSPPELHHDTFFRRRRLALLAQAGESAAELDAEWQKLLSDFPEEVPLMLERSDLLAEAGRHDEARQQVEAALLQDPGSPHALARRVQLAPPEQSQEDFLAQALSVLFAEDRGDWPSDAVWEKARQKALCAPLADAVLEKLVTGQRPADRAVALMVAEFRGRDPARQSPLGAFAHWPGGKGFRALRRTLEALDRVPWYAGPLRGDVIAAMEEIGHHRFVATYARKNPERVGAHSGTWAQVGRTLLSTDRRAARQILSDWRKRAGIELWMVSNYVLTLPERSAAQRRFMARECLDALRLLPHDHSARFLAHTAAWQHLRAGDRDAFLATWNKYRTYLEREGREGEWFPAHAVRNHAKMSELVPGIEAGGAIPAWKLWFHGLSQPAQNGGSNTSAATAIISGIVLLSLLRACAELGMH